MFSCVALRSKPQVRVIVWLALMLLVGGSGCSQKQEASDASATRDEPQSAASSGNAKIGIVDESPIDGHPTAPSKNGAPNQATNPDKTAKPAPRRSTGPITASGVLESMAAAYRNATSYADAGRIEVNLNVAGESTKESAPCSVTFKRPNQLRLHVYQGNLLSDGRQMRGWIDTQNANEPFAGQILTLDAPEKLSLETIYADDVLTGYLTRGIAGSALQLLLLLSDDPLAEIQADAERPVLLEPQAIDQRMCHRVLMARPDGKLVLWVDQQDHLLRRMELPTDQFRQQLSQQGEVKELSVVMELKGARVNGKIDDTAFQLEMPADAELVKQFDPRELMPEPPPAPPLLGKSAPSFAFKDLEGKQVTTASLAGKVAVLDFWFTNCPPCREALPRLEQVYQQFKDNDEVRFIAVSVDPAEIGDDKLKEMFATLEVTLPIARDADQSASEALGIAGFPTTILLGPDGIVQDFEAGANPQLATLLPAKIKQVLNGDAVYKQVLAEHEKRLKEYERAMQEPQIKKAAIAPRSEPKRHTLEKLFSCTELKQPGNLLVVESTSASPIILAHDGWRKVVEIGLDGAVAATHELAIPDEEVVATLRTAIGKDGKRYFLGLATSQKQVHLFDDGWQLLTSYPADRDHAGVADALLADLNGDGELEISVSYWGVVGVQGASLEGKRIWSNRSMEHVFRIAVTGPDEKGMRRLLCANGTGSPVLVGFEGQNDEPLAIGSHFIRSVHSADLNGDDRPEWLALASTSTGSDIAVAFNLAGEELWNYPLPVGVQEHPTLEVITAGKLAAGDPTRWVVAGADGSVHFLSGEGELIDKFHSGAAISGLAIAHHDGQSMIVIASSEGVEGWKITASK